MLSFKTDKTGHPCKSYDDTAFFKQVYTGNLSRKTVLKFGFKKKTKKVVQITAFCPRTSSSSFLLGKKILQGTGGVGGWRVEGWVSAVTRTGTPTHPETAAACGRCVPGWVVPRDWLPCCQRWRHSCWAHSAPAGTCWCVTCSYDLPPWGWWSATCPASCCFPADHKANSDHMLATKGSRGCVVKPQETGRRGCGFNPSPDQNILPLLSLMVVDLNIKLFKMKNWGFMWWRCVHIKDHIAMNRVPLPNSAEIY